MFKVKSRKPTPGSISNAEICRAVSERLVVRCTYGDSAERLVEPHCHGHSHAGQEILSAYQVSGPAGTEAGWKMFDVRKIGSFEVTTEHFEQRPDFNPEQPGVKQVHCHVKLS